MVDGKRPWNLNMSSARKRSGCGRRMMSSIQDRSEMDSDHSVVGQMYTRLVPIAKMC